MYIVYYHHADVERVEDEPLPILAHQDESEEDADFFARVRLARREENVLETVWVKMGEGSTPESVYIHTPGTLDRQADEREPPHSHNCVCADCSGAELTARNE